MPAITASALEWLHPRENRLVDHLATLVGIPTHVSQPDGVAAMAGLVSGDLKSLAFAPAELPPLDPASRVPAWAQRVLSPDAGVESLHPPIVLRRPGSAVRVLALADLDAALVSNADECRLDVRDGRAFGPAVADMKGGIVVLTAAIEAAVRLGVALPTITVVLSADEQAGSIRSGPVIGAVARDAEWVVCVECARGGGRVMHSRAHIGIGRLVARGREAHAGTDRDAGVNAIWHLAQALTALGAPDVSRPDGFATPTMLSGGRRRSLVPAEASAVIDVRARDSGSWNELEKRLNQAVADTGLRDAITLELFNHRPGVQRTVHTERLLDVVRSAAADIGVDMGSTDSMAAGSSAFVDSRRVPVLDGMGPAGGSLMTTDEYIEVDSLAQRAAVLAGTFAALA